MKDKNRCAAASPLPVFCRFTYPLELSIYHTDFVTMTPNHLPACSASGEASASLAELLEAAPRALGLELHDAVGPDLAAVSMMLAALRAGLHASPSLQAQLDAAQSQLQKATQTLRLLSRGLTPQEVAAGRPQDALAALADEWTARRGMACTFEAADANGEKGRFDDVPAATGQHLLRIAQEALNNAQRHGRATQACIRLMRGEHSHVLEIEDNGSGFAPARPGRGAGLGLRSMAVRAASFRGVAECLPGPGGGVLVRVRWPAAASADS